MDPFDPSCAEEIERDVDPKLLLARILRYDKLRAVYQPLFALADATVYGFEGLIRGPRRSGLEAPADLFALAEACDQRVALEIAAARVVVREFAAAKLPGNLLLNLSCPALLAYAAESQRTIDFITSNGLSPAAVVIELTEHERVHDIAALKRSLSAFREAGMSIAVDDFGDGHSNLRLWMELRPSIVKIDRFFVQGLGTDGDKFEIVRLLTRFASSFGTQIVAEGVEELVDLLAARDLGIAFGQGFLLGRPERAPVQRLGAEVEAALRSSRLAVHPAREGAPLAVTLAGDLAQPIPSVSGRITSEELSTLFARHPDWHGVAIVDDDAPWALVNRITFVDRYARPYAREVHGRKSCRAFGDANPTMVDRRTPVESLRTLLAGADQRYLRDGFIVTDNGRYVGLATGEHFVRAVTELRVEAARYANPLTFLPGNIPISQHIDRLLASGVPFTACYADLNHFKPFNDQFGYWRGDEVIRLAAKVLHDEIDPVGDFLGHVGGDDFFVVYQSLDWERRCRRSVAQFNALVREHFPNDALETDGFWGEDRSGDRRFFPLTTMSIGALPVASRTYSSHEALASAAALAKRHAKLAGVDVHVVGWEEALVDRPAPRADGPVRAA